MGKRAIPAHLTNPEILNVRRRKTVKYGSPSWPSWSERAGVDAFSQFDTGTDHVARRASLADGTGTDDTGHPARLVAGPCRGRHAGSGERRRGETSSRAGFGRRAVLRGGRTPRLCAPGHTGDEHRWLWLADVRVWQPAARRWVREKWDKSN